MRYLPIILIAFALACTATQRVLNSPSKTRTVVDAYTKTHPFKNDTTYLQTGDSSTTVIIRYDTTYLEPEIITDAPYNIPQAPTIPCKPKTMRITKNIVQTITKTYTLRQKITDNSFKNELQEQLERMTHNKNLWRNILIVVLLALGGYVYLKYIKK